MSKILVVLFLFLTAFLAPTAHADNLKDCPLAVARTDPTPIFSDSAKVPRATFFINVGNNKDYDKWKMQFECGIFQSIVDARKESNGVEISAPKDNGPNACEFFAGTHNIKVIAVTNQGEIPQCRVLYTIAGSDNQCQLDINPHTGITSATSVTVSGQNLTQGGQFALFMDDQTLMGKHYDFVQTPSFSGYKIPNAQLTPTSHIVSLRKYNSANAIPLPFASYIFSKFSGPLCSTTFTVGTPSNPGSANTPNASPSPRVEQPVIAGGQPAQGCGIPDKAGVPDPRGLGIKTAIGCIHTSPAEFVKDFMTFIIGISGGLAFLMMLVGAFQILSSADNPDTLRAGRERLTSAVIGLLIVIFAVLLLQIIGIGILNIPGFK